MEGLIPFVFNAITKKSNGNEYRCLSEGSSRGRPFLLSENVGSFEGSSHWRMRSDFQTPTSEIMELRSPGPVATYPSQMIHKRSSHQKADSNARF